MKSEGIDSGDNNSSLILDPNSDDDDELLEIGKKDRFMLLYFSFWLLGIAQMYPFNVFVNATAFFQLKFQNSPFADNFSSGYQHHLHGHCNENCQISGREKAGGLFFYPCIGCFRYHITALVYPEVDPIIFFWITMVLTVLNGIYNSFVQNGIFTIIDSSPSLHRFIDERIWFC